MRVLIYANGITDIALCRRYAANHQWQVDDVYGDDHIKGSALERPGIKALFKAAEEGAFDVLLTPSPREISRNLEDYMAIIQYMDSKGVKVLTLGGEEGASLVSTVVVASAEFEDKLSEN